MQPAITRHLPPPLLRGANGPPAVPHLPRFGPDRVKLRSNNKEKWEAVMAQAAVRNFAGSIGAPEDAVLDRDYLARMTFGDQSLEKEVLQLFDRQAELLMMRMRVSEPAAVVTLAHTLKGSAVGIGAGRVACAAESAELVASRAPGECGHAIDRLAQAVDETRIRIAAILHAH
jgi:HPt (histidine-containing phosphotransfer) domain-containing protein